MDTIRKEVRHENNPGDVKKAQNQPQELTPAEKDEQLKDWFDQVKLFIHNIDIDRL